MTPAAFYAGSFDPITNGHLDVVRQACRLFDELTIGIGVNPGKQPMFSEQERLSLIKTVCGPIASEENCTLKVMTFSDLVIFAARRAKSQVLVRGLRDGTDLDYEMQMAGMNERLAPDLQTVFLPASPNVRPITATLVRQIASMGGDVTGFVPAAVAEKLAARFGTGDKGVIV